MEQPGDPVAEGLALFHVELLLHLFEELVQFGVAERDVVAALSGDLGRVPHLIEVRIEGAGPAQAADVVVPGVQVLHVDRPLHVADLHVDPGLGEGLLEHGHEPLLDGAAGHLHHGEGELFPVLLEDPVAVGVTPARLGQQSLRLFRIVRQRLQAGGQKGASRHEGTDGGLGQPVVDLLPDPFPVHQKRQGVPHPFVLKEGIFLVVADVVVLGQQIFELAQYPLAELRRAGPLHVLVREQAQTVQVAPQQGLKTGVGVFDDLENEILQ